MFKIRSGEFNYADYGNSDSYWVVPRVNKSNFVKNLTVPLDPQLNPGMIFGYQDRELDHKI